MPRLAGFPAPLKLATVQVLPPGDTLAGDVLKVRELEWDLWTLQPPSTLLYTPKGPEEVAGWKMQPQLKQIKQE